MTPSVVGEKNAAQAVVNSLSKIFAKNVVYSRKVMMGHAGRFRYLRKYRSEELQQIDEQFKPYRARISFSWDGSRGNASVVLQATKQGLARLQTEVERIVKAPFDFERVVQKHGLVRYLDSDRFSLERKEVERKHDVVVWVQGEEVDELDDDETSKGRDPDCHSNTLADYTSKQYPDRRIAIFSGDICKHRTDAIVNAANEGLQHGAGVAGHIAQCAGFVVQKESSEYVQKHGCLRTGKATHTTAGRLTTTKYIIHAVGPTWPGNQSSLQARKMTEDQLNQAVQSSLRVAEKLNCRSVSLPAISSGIFGCPAAFVAKHMVTAASSYLTGNASSPVKEIHFVLLERDRENIGCFQQECNKMSAFERKQFKDTLLSSFSMPKASLPASSHRVRGTSLGQVVIPAGHNEPSPSTCIVPNATFKLSVRPGDITEQRVDVILNSVGGDLNLDSALASRAVSKKAGPQLQMECSTHVETNGQMKDGDLFTTGSYELPCKKVIHVVTPKTQAGLKQLVDKSLFESVRLGSRSVAIPALGTGKLGMSDSEAVNGIFDGIDTFVSHQLSNSLERIDVIVFDKSKIATFQQAQRQRYAMDIRQDSLQTPDNEFKLHNSVLLTIEQGDVTTDTSDVIVAPRGVVLHAVCARSQQTKSNMTSASPIADVVAGNGLRCKRVYAVSIPSRDTSSTADACVQAVRTVIDQCFIQANSNGLQSIAIPAVGTGGLGYTNQQVAAAIVESAKHFSNTTTPISLRTIKITLSDSHRLPDFEKEARSRIAGSSIRNMKQNPVRLCKRRALSSGEPDNLRLAVTGHNRQVCEQAVDELQQTIKRFCIQLCEPIEHEVPEGFDIAELKDIAAEFRVGLQLNLPQGDEDVAMLVLDGFCDDVNDVQKKVLRRLNKALKDEREALERERILDAVTWYWQEDNGSFRPYSPDSIVKLEIAFSGRKGKVKITEGGKDLEVDVEKRQQNEAGRVRMVQRKVNADDRVDHRLGGTEIIFPGNWSDPPSGGKNEYVVYRHKLNNSDPEYLEVETLFKQTGGGGTIVSIERIQNPNLYSKYTLEKQSLEKKRRAEIKAGKAQLARRLFHGTKQEAVAPIITDGFNRSFAGTARGKALGAGVYFASDASTSLSYAQAGSQGRKMFLCDVLIGMSILGNDRMLEPPVINASVSATDKYDSTINNTQPPSVFVSCYRDHMAYPSYLITF